jgi:hypothetical protein
MAIVTVIVVLDRREAYGLAASLSVPLVGLIAVNYGQKRLYAGTEGIGETGNTDRTA